MSEGITSTTTDVVGQQDDGDGAVPGITVVAPGSPALAPVPVPLPVPQDSVMNPPTQSPKQTTAQSQTSPQSSQTSQTPQAQSTPFGKDDKTGMATMAGRRHKVVLAPGHSHMDWMRKTNSEPNLSGTGGLLLRVNRKELSKHNTKEDAWMVLRGKVYNITPYLAFHPGGVDELMKGAGRDGTKLFDHKHSWVNAESLLAKCLVGIFVNSEV